MSDKVIDTTAEIEQFESKFDETAITARDFISKVKEILEVINDCSIKDLREMFYRAMEARGSIQDMSQFAIMNAATASLFIRQIGGAVNEFCYDDLHEFYNYVMALKQKAENAKTTANN